MRDTSRTIACDRCGVTKPVKSWEYKEMKVLSDLGWVCYRSFGPDNWQSRNHTKYNYNSHSPSTIADLCPTCSTGMSQFMKHSEHVYIRVNGDNGAGHGAIFPTTYDDTGVRVADFEGAADVMLTDMRKSINAELRQRRKNV